MRLSSMLENITISASPTYLCIAGGVGVPSHRLGDFTIVPDQNSALSQ